jgi:hypothetical protein
MCRCNMCMKEKVVVTKVEDGNLFDAKTKASTPWLKRLLDNLCLSGARTLKLNLPDLLFVMG